MRVAQPPNREVSVSAIRRAVSLTAVLTVLIGTQFSIIPSAHAGDSTCWDYRDAERTFARKINLARSAASVGKLSLDPELSRVARKHTREMVNRDSLYHTPSDVLSRRVTRWIELGENVGFGGGVESLHDAFMDSTAHRDNVLHDSFRHVGIGVAKKDGRMWVTVIFESKEDPGTRLKMPRC